MKNQQKQCCLAVFQQADQNSRCFKMLNAFPISFVPAILGYKLGSVGGGLGIREGDGTG